MDLIFNCLGILTNNNYWNLCNTIVLCNIIKLQKPKLILHIGTEKTGTSTIQKFLGTNRTFLSEQGFEVPISTRENNFGENQR